ncbi:MAG TPA: hypothetical protein VMV94_17300 [Phycisphaerae bacterium]|nr:hypothetical protein [Phycisphaerae bacterium]
MKTVILAVCTLALAAMVVYAEPPATPPNAPAVSQKPPPVPSTPAAVDNLVYARKFTLQEGYQHLWSKDKPTITTGYLLVLKVDPNLVYARQVAEPVLYVGNQTAERLNIGYESGYVVAIAPGDVDLKKATIWFGTPELPERVDANMVKAEAAKAKAANIGPFTEKVVQEAQTKGTGELKVTNRAELLRTAAELILQYSPQEKQLAESLAPQPAKPAPAPAGKS